MKMNYVIIGNGPSGVNAVESIRKRDTEGKITLISKENNAPYSRIMVPELISGEIEEPDIYYRGTDFYERYDVSCRLGVTVAEIEPCKKEVLLETGESVAFDKLLIATGSSPVVLPFMRDTPEGVFSLWNKADAEKLNKYLEGNVDKTVIIGGGLVGLQAARAFAGRGKDITLIESQPHLMSAQLDKAAGRMLMDAAGKAGVQVMCGVNVQALETANGLAAGKIAGVQTNQGKIPADLVLITTGARPNLDFTDGSGLKMGRGLLVNDEMRTSIPDIFAAGDVAEAAGILEEENILRPLWLCAVKQGKVAGTNMAGGSLRYEGSMTMNSIDLFGMPIISMGMLAGPELEEIIIQPPDKNVYQKLLLCQDKLMGFILIGDVRQAGLLAARLGQAMGDGFSGAYKNLDPAFYYA